MTGRRILYALLLIGCTLMHFAYGQYVTHYILLFMLLLPVLSLLISLPAILTSSAELTGGEDVRRTRAAKVWLTVRCRFFLPVSSSRAVLVCGIIATSASAIGIPSFSNASRTAEKSSGAVRTSK